MRDGKRNFAGNPYAESLKPTIMLRALLLSFAILAINLGPCAAQPGSPVIKIANNTDLHINSELPTPQSSSAAGPSSVEDSAAENELLEAANRSREEAGVPPLRIEDGLRKAAREHALWMVAGQRLEHQMSGEPALLERIAQASPLKMDRAGENLANATCAPGANEVLMQSPPHRQNLLDPTFNVVGIAAVWSQGRLYVVQDFAREIPSYSVLQSRKLVSRAVDEMRQQAGLAKLAQLTPPDLDKAACSLAGESRPNARLLATAYDNRKIITYTQSRPEVLPQGALRLLRDPGVRQFAVGSCYARNASDPTGMYWVAILLY